MNPDKSSALFRFQERLRVARQGGRKVDISFLLDEAKEARIPEDFVRWLEQVLVWIRISGGSGTSSQTSLKFLLAKICQNPEWKASTSHLLQQLLLQGSFVKLFSDTGVHSNYAFFHEALDRLVRGLFPAYGDLSNMDTAVGRIFHREEDAEWIGHLPPEQRAQILECFFSDEPIQQKIKNHLMNDVAEACSFLCVRLSAVSIQRDITVRAGKTRVADIPPLRLRAPIERYFAELLSGRNRTELQESYDHIKMEIAHSRKYLEDVRAHLEQYGVSVGIVFSLETAHSILDRIELLLRFSRWLCFSEGNFDPWLFFADFLRATHDETRITPLIKSNFHLLSQKIVEKSGATGENYITGNREEYRAMFFAAMGGGFITAFTALFKYLGPASLAPFVLGLYAALNYSFSFILMHHLHFKLATKQPAMTAAALAERLRLQGEDHHLTGFIDLVARISRSQFAAVAGNILAVIPTAIAIDWIARLWLGRSVLGGEYAEHALESLHPIATFTIFYAALTGVLLWISGLFAGWVENAFIYFRIPVALEGHQFLANLFGPERLNGIVHWISKNLSGWTSSVALGFSLAFVPVAGSFFGLPLDVRHVTLSTGSASFAIASLGWAHVSGLMLLFTIAGILFIGAMNFGVSFFLALHIAVRANNIPSKRILAILRACGREFLRHPRKFFLP